MTSAGTAFICFATRERPADPVERADFLTSVADLRAAVCVAAGVDLDDISPLGYDHSAAAYRRIREGWMYHVTQWGITMYDHGLASAYALWLEARPDLAAGDDWRADAEQRHREEHPAPAGCFYGDTCVICHPIPEEWL